MKLNHLNLAVSDVPQARAFLVKYFGFDTGGKPGNDTIAVLRDDSGMVLTLTNIDGAAEVKYPGAFHIGFIQESREKVDEINRRLKEDGVEVDPGLLPTLGALLWRGVEVVQRRSDDPDLAQPEGLRGHEAGGGSQSHTSRRGRRA